MGADLRGQEALAPAAFEMEVVLKQLRPEFHPSREFHRPFFLREAKLVGAPRTTPTSSTNNTITWVTPAASTFYFKS